MNKNQETHFISWLFQRARRSAKRIMKGFYNERQSEMAGTEFGVVRSIHTLALFETLRQVNMPEYLTSHAMEIEDDIISEYIEFLGKAHERFEELAGMILNWEPKANHDQSPAKKSTVKHAQPSNN